MNCRVGTGDLVSCGEQKTPPSLFSCPLVPTSDEATADSQSSYYYTVRGVDPSTFSTTVQYLKYYEEWDKADATTWS